MDNEKKRENQEKILNQEEMENNADGHYNSKETEDGTNEAAPQETAEAKADDQGVSESEEIDSRIKNLIEEKESYIALAKRVQADFDNYRKRNNKAVAEAFEEGMAEAVLKILPVLDNLERALEATQKNSTDDAFVEGLDKIIKQFLDILHKMGLEEIPALGEDFDPEIHNAVMQAEVEEGQKEGMIVEVFQKGYKMKDKVLRYSMVKVAK
ncbi:MAG: nucleotide exchange factor GrpE [Clostridia bacterium]|jgi:molecular chaperone GrpE